MLSVTSNPSDFFLLWPAFALLLATSVSNVLRSTFYATGEMRYEAIETICEGVILLAATSLVALLHLGLPAYLWAYAASYTFTCIFAPVIIWRRYFRPRINIDLGLVAAPDLDGTAIRDGLLPQHRLLPDRRGHPDRAPRGHPGRLLHRRLQVPGRAIRLCPKR